MTARAEKHSENRRAEGNCVAQESVRNNPLSASGSEFSPVPKVGQREAFQLGLEPLASKNRLSIAVLNQSDRRDFAGHIAGENAILFSLTYVIGVTDANSDEFWDDRLRTGKS